MISGIDHLHDLLHKLILSLFKLNRRIILMLNSPESTTTPSNSLNATDTALMDLINGGHDIYLQIEALQAKLDEHDKQTDAAFTARNELAALQGQEVYRHIDDFVDAVS